MDHEQFPCHVWNRERMGVRVKDRHTLQAIVPLHSSEDIRYRPGQWLLWNLFINAWTNGIIEGGSCV